MQLGELVSGAPFVCGPDATLAEVAEGMQARDHGSAGVIEGRELVGVITERDLVRAVARRADLTIEPVRAWMSVDPDVFSPSVDVFEAAEWVLESGYRHLPVVDGGELLGIVSVRDLLAAVLSELED
ncbi:MAG: signal transduction protein [Acidimicrobiia bacterium]|nr:MAG: signal transduction protein [Acidimicrobiia bacterium]